MTSPTVETFCCISSKMEPSILTKLQFDSVHYNIVCTISSVLGTIGALYQIIPIPRERSRNMRSVANRQRSLINWLAVADLFASLGIMLRSIYWLVNGDIIKSQVPGKNTNLMVCVILSVCIRYFYTATYLWNLCYAYDVYLVSKQKAENPIKYHIFTWLISAGLTIFGLGTLYLPSFRCHSGPWRVLPNYLLSFVPIVLVMIANPILYYLASKNLRILVSGSLGQLTCLEQNLLSALKEKFFCIVLVFYVCWVPNVLNGILLWSFWSHIPQYALLTVWYLMAIVNPLQAVLNSVVYKGWKSCPEFCGTLFCRYQSVFRRDLPFEDSSSEYCISSVDENVNTTNPEVQ